MGGEGGRWETAGFEALDFDGRREDPTEVARELGLDERAEPGCGSGEVNRELLADVGGRREELADVDCEECQDVADEAIGCGEEFREELALLDAADFLIVGLEALRCIDLDDDMGGFKRLPEGVCDKLLLRTRR